MMVTATASVTLHGSIAAQATGSDGAPCAEGVVSCYLDSFLDIRQADNSEISLQSYRWGTVKAEDHTILTTDFEYMNFNPESRTLETKIFFLVFPRSTILIGVRTVFSTEFRSFYDDNDEDLSEANLVVSCPSLIVSATPFTAIIE
jgi:hypothetical protein